MNRTQALSHVSYSIDDSLNVRTGEEIPAHARLVGWQCGFEPMFVAVWSYIPNCHTDDDEAEEIATDYLREIGWFADGPIPADYIL